MVFDISMDNGYDNCYLLNATGSPNKGTNATFAQLTSGPTVVPVSHASDHGNKTMAWIAGPVIGGVIALILLFGGIFWWRRRQKELSEEQQSDQARSHPPLPQNQGMEKTSSGLFEMNGHTHENSYMLPADREPRELRDPKTEAILQHELET